MKNIIKRSFFALSFLFVSSIALAQNPDDPGGNPDEGIPIDGGISLLIGGSILYGAKKLKEKYKAENDQDSGKKSDIV